MDLLGKHPAFDLSGGKRIYARNTAKPATFIAKSAELHECFVSTLAGLNPFAVLLTGMFFGMLRSASISMNLTNSVPIDMITVLQGLIVILIATPTLWVTLKSGFLLLRERLHTKRGGQDAKEASQQ